MSLSETQHSGTSITWAGIASASEILLRQTTLHLFSSEEVERPRLLEDEGISMSLLPTAGKYLKLRSRNPTDRVERQFYSLAVFRMQLLQMAELHKLFHSRGRMIKSVADTLGLTRNGVYERMQSLGCTQVDFQKTTTIEELLMRSKTLGPIARALIQKEQ